MIIINIIFSAITFTASLRENTPDPYYIAISIAFILAWVIFTHLGNTPQLKFAQFIAYSIIVCSLAMITIGYGFIDEIKVSYFVLPLTIFELAINTPLSGLIRHLPFPAWFDYTLLIIVSILWIYICNRKLKRLK